MKKLFALIIVLTLALTMLASCDIINNVLGTTPEKICQHRDADDNSLCDKCKEPYLDGIDVDSCHHKDSNDDNLCDKCSIPYSDGKDIPDTPVCQHRDEDDNSLCDKCNEAYTDGTDLTHSHSFTSWTNYSANGNVSCEERLFYRTCETCGGIEWKTGTYAEHSFSTSIVEPTCKDEGTETRTCSICGLVETNSIPTTSHTYSAAYTSNNSFHWLECIHCGAKKDETEHTPDAEGFCSICNRPVGATEGVIYDKSADGTYSEVIGYSGSAKRVIIADTYNDLPVKSIYSEAFKETNITEIVIPESVTSIGSYAFNNCDRLTSVVIGNSVTSIGDSAFSNCSSLTSVVIPDSVTSISNYAFYYCFNLMSVIIPDSVTSIGDNAFYYCRSLTSVTIEGAPNIGEHAFSSCNSALYTEYELGRYVGTPENPYKILIEVTNANLSTYTIHENTEIIGNNVFSICARLTSITIPDNVKTISFSAFYSCTGLTSVTIGNSVTSIGNSAFQSCNKLTSVVIPDSVTSIGGMAFTYCFDLTIYCEAESKPEGWDSTWNPSNRPVVWGYEGSEE